MIVQAITASPCIHSTGADTCAAAGHTSGCCVVGTTDCSGDGDGESCYCDLLCHSNVDCCEDIFDIGCYDGGIIIATCMYNAHFVLNLHAYNHSEIYRETLTPCSATNVAPICNNYYALYT